MSPSAAGPQGVITVEDNDVVSRRTALAANTPQGWGFQNGIHVNAPPAAAVNIIRRNRVTRAHTGITSSRSAVVHDNTIVEGVYAFRQLSTLPLTFQRNDAVGLLNSFTAPAAGGSYQCNWWGSVAGPTTPPGSVPAGMYTPWATAPIAGTTNPCGVISP